MSSKLRKTGVPAPPGVPLKIFSGSENSKSFKSPTTAIFAFGSTAKILSTKSFTACACCLRCASEVKVGG
ncbi:MAG: hypothetical protein HC908_03395 [Calothrix sp. SM1_7_51]|nr:hypothetical protein [Calothrix sp. SM1_7_51]